MKLIPVALFLALVSYSLESNAQVDKFNLAGRYRVVQNI